MSMEGVNDMNEILQTVHEKVLNHGERIAVLEKSDKNLRDEITTIKTAVSSINEKLGGFERTQLELKSAVHETASEMRSVYRDGQEMTRGLFKSQEMVIAQLSTALETEAGRNHETTKLDVELKDKRSARFWEWLGKAAGAGGIIAAAATWAMNYFQ